MGRIRHIKPQFFLDHKIARLGKCARLLFIGLWTLADREGRLEDIPEEIKAQVFPYEGGLDVNQYLQELASGGFITRYAVGGRPFINITNFLKHQRPAASERASVIPAYIGQRTYKDLQTTNISVRKGDGEGKGDGEVQQPSVKDRKAHGRLMDIRMTFGEKRGVHVANLDAEYCRWLLTRFSGRKNIKGSLREALEARVRAKDGESSGKRDGGLSRVDGGESWPA